ncbi:hypothetical protein B0H12DRAFT_1243934 [Mycena haematopus]|nr:hypothetical protein B0H12DRAFT_1243934 [Mycena haematopus]
MKGRRIHKRPKHVRGAGRESHEYLFSRPVDDFLPPPVDAPINTRVERLTADGCRVRAEVVPVEPPSPVKRQRQENPSTDAAAEGSWPWEPLDFDPEGVNGEHLNMELGGFYPRAESPTPRRRQRPVDPWKPSDKSLFEYRALRDEYLTELLRLDGCGDASESSCPSCHIGVPTIRCRHCYGEELYCVECSVREHQRQPLHVVEVRVTRPFSTNASAVEN